MLALNATAQKIDPDTCTPPADYENIAVTKIFSDSLNSTFVIWVKKGVKPHKHNHHTECITVIDGEAEMTLGDTTFTIKKGDMVFIPMGTVHSVKVISKKPLKVVSTQAPNFDGSDREFIKP